MVFHLFCRAMISCVLLSHAAKLFSSLKSMASTISQMTVFLVEVVLLGFFQGFEVLLVASVDGCGCGFEPCPDFVAQFFGYGACVAEFLMQFLQLVEG